MVFLIWMKISTNETSNLNEDRLLCIRKFTLHKLKRKDKTKFKKAKVHRKTYIYYFNWF